MDNKEYKERFKKRLYVYTLNSLRELDKITSRDISTQVILKQVIRSLTSVGANFIEAQASSSRKDFSNFISYSLKSSNETKFWLSLLRDLGKMDKIKADVLLRETIEISKMLGSTVLRLKSRKE